MYNLLRKWIGRDADLPSVSTIEIAFALVEDAISFCYYGYLCKIEPQKQPVNINSTKVENVELMRICRLKKQLEDDILEKYIYAWLFDLLTDRKGLEQFEKRQVG